MVRSKYRKVGMKRIVRMNEGTFTCDVWSRSRTAGVERIIPYGTAVAESTEANLAGAVA